MHTGVNGTTKILGVIGDPIKHSLSPQIHNTIIRSLNLNYVYVPFWINEEDLEDAFKGFKAIKISGFNITIPHKKSAIKFLDEVSQEALLMGAVNTVKNIDGKLYGYNTDGDGFIRSLRQQGLDVKDKNVVVLGAGGSARGICVKMAMEEANSITILNRTYEKAEEICNIINENIKSIAKCDILEETSLKRHMGNCDLLINTTPIGMYPHEEDNPVETLDFINPTAVVCDLIYNPSTTKLLRVAEERGLKTINGWGMLVFQAVNAFEIWTGVKVDKLVVDDILDKNNGKEYKKNIVLIGFMGTGKTVVGRTISSKLNNKFLDVDVLIEEESGMTISDIFSQKGEEYFRDIESRIIKKISLMSNVVIATGGGAVLRKENIDNLRKNGLIVLLKADVSTILKNVSYNSNRPLLQLGDAKTKVIEMLKKRKEYYNNNDFEFDISDKSIEQVAEDVLNVLKEHI